MANYHQMQEEAFDINRQAFDDNDYPLYPLMAGRSQQIPESAFDLTGEPLDLMDALDINGDHHMDIVDINGDLITPADTYSYREYASQYASHQSAYLASPADVPFSSTSDDYPAVPFLGAPAAPQMPFVSPVPSFDDNDANNHDGFSWASQYPPVPEQYAPMSAQYPFLPQQYAPLPAQYPPLPTYPFTFSPSPQSPSSPTPSDLALTSPSPSPPPSPSPSDLALSDYTPTPAPSSWTQTAAYHHLAPLTKYALVTRWAAEERAPPFRPRYSLPADKAPLQSPERPAARSVVVPPREDTPPPARPVQRKRKRSVEVREETLKRPAPALRKAARWVRKAVPAVVRKKTAAPQRKVVKAAAAAPARKCRADEPVVQVVTQPDRDVEMTDADESEFDSGSEIGEADSEYEEAAPRCRRC